jgi:hypothetical protein
MGGNDLGAEVDAINNQRINTAIPVLADWSLLIPITGILGCLTLQLKREVYGAAGGCCHALGGIAYKHSQVLTFNNSHNS